MSWLGKDKRASALNIDGGVKDVSTYNRTSSLRRSLALLAVATATVCAVAAVPASAELIELGEMSNSVKASCPESPCLAVTKVTGFQMSDGVKKNAFVSKHNGRIVAWTIKLGKPSSRQISFFEDRFGGESKARVSVLRKVKKSKSKFRYVVTSQSDVVSLKPYFGRTVQFPLPLPMTIRKGYIVALSVPTWAPTLAIGLPNTALWRASRGAKSCANTQRQAAQERKSEADYECTYKTARLAYSATMITSPS